MLRRLTLGLALATLCAGARADTLVLANGDTLNGEILEWAVDYVVIEHPQLGPVRLSLDQLEIDTGTPPRKPRGRDLRRYCAGAPTPGRLRPTAKQSGLATAARDRDGNQRPWPRYQVPGDPGPVEFGADEW